MDVNNQLNRQDQKWSLHVTECLKGDRLFRAGDKAEKDVVQFLLDNLSTDSVGDYRILMNYHMPFFNERGLDQFQEIDIVLINKFGIYVLEVKDWAGRIIAAAMRRFRIGRLTCPLPSNAVTSLRRRQIGQWSRWS